MKSHWIRSIRLSFAQFLNQVKKDAMLMVVCLAPFLCGLFFKFGIPYTETLIEKYLGIVDGMKPYFLIFDIFLGLITPMMYCFIAAMVVLSEMDDKTVNSYFVTPVGKKGYLISRIGIPAIISFAVSIGVIQAFALTKIGVIGIISISFMSVMIGIMMSLAVVTLAHNKVQGLAVTKLSGIVIFAILVPFFIRGPIKFLLSPLPSLWVSEYAINKDFRYMMLSTLLTVAWSALLLRKFLKKLY